MLSQDTLTRAEARVPRYTSYPTAPHFAKSVGPAQVAEWYRAIPECDPVSVYIHVPFCTKLCWYCGCNTSIASKYQPVHHYLETLVRELHHARELLGRRAPVSHLHFGGGTPNALSAADFARLGDILHALFEIEPLTSFDIELDPRTLDAKMAWTLAGAGVTRVNLGIQDFDPNVQAAINRVQTFADVRARLDELRVAGISNFGVDLLYGLPRQDEATIAATVDSVADLGASRVALFGYAHVPWMKPHQKLLEPHGLPGPEARMKLMQRAHARLAARGYVRVGIDHFAKPEDELAVALREGRLQRNFQGYTTDAARTLLGFGPSAISAFRQGYAQNHTRLDEWRAAVEGNALPVARGRALAPDDRLRRSIIERLMCEMKADVGSIAAEQGLPGSIEKHFAGEFARIDRFAAEGLCTREGTCVTIPPAATSFARIVASAFDAYLDGGEAKHSVAV
ncbi:MAG: oxygen-independent coproporphyrinogen III oxidase [Rhodospirillales bacterium]|nr:oxygen-independent coproporphyrinogen III oxidase [Rhodospirillales bacterium]